MALSDAASRIPVTVLTGFLGSGKTTLLDHVLKQPDMAATAVIVNEFGEIGLDHLLVESATDDVVLLNSGCLCCTVRGDIVNTLTDLFVKRVKGQVPYFTRAVIETTGLADPAPVLHALLSDPIVAERYMIDGVVTTVDAVNGGGTLDRQIEAVKQAAVADRLILTKADLAEPRALSAIEARLAALNPGAPLLHAAHGAIDAAELVPGGGDGVAHQRQQDRRRVGEPGRLDDDAAERRQLAARAPVKEIGQRLAQRVEQRAAEAPRLEQQHVVAPAGHQQMVEPDLAELVDDDDAVRHRLVPQQPVEQRRLAAAEKPGEHVDWDARAGAHRAGLKPRSRQAVKFLDCRSSARSR